MLNLKKIALIAVLAVCSPHLFGQDKMADLLKRELNSQMNVLSKKELPAYYMSYRIVDKKSETISSSLGVISKTKSSHSAMFIPQIRVGDRNLDNFASSDMGTKENNGGGRSYGFIPMDKDGSEAATLQAIHNEVNNRYQFATEMYKFAKSKDSIMVKELDKAAWFSDATVEKHYEAPLDANKMNIDLEMWKKRLKEISNIFNNYPYLRGGNARLAYNVERRYFVDTEGREIVQNLPYIQIMVDAWTKADDGMTLPLSTSYFAFSPENLPSNEKIIADAHAIAKKLGELRVAPMAEPYTGPALLSGAASGVFFHEIFGHRIEGQRMKRESDGQTFKNMIGELVLAKSMHVYDDPTMKSYKGQDLNGYYVFDDQGVRGERVTVVKDGLMNDFLMTRTPIDNHPRSNGHARVDQSGKDPVSRQSNLIIETSDHKTEAELRALFITELKKQKKDFGYFFKEVTGGFTLTGKRSINSFNVTPLEVYQIYADGRPDLLVRGVDLIGTPLSMFSNIVSAGGEAQIFTGTCGAESGPIPVTAISPTIFVSKVEVQRKSKNSDIAPILSSPKN